MECKKLAIFSLITFWVIVSIVSIVLIPGNSLAWWSWPPEENTHRSLSEGAIANIPQDQYPDVTTIFGDDIIDWTSNVTDDQRAHGNYSDRNDGPVGYWWKLALTQYGVFEFTGPGDPLASPKPGAYYYLALIVHLTEDMGVPAHAYNILHSQSNDDLDNMEHVAFSSYREANPLIIIQDTGKDPLQCYYLSREHTLSLTSPSYWRLYYNNDGTCGLRYGTPAGYYWEFCGAPDIFPEKWDDTTPAERQVISSLLGASGGYAGGILVAASRSLPPLVKDLTIGPGSDPDSGSDLVPGSDSDPDSGSDPDSDSGSDPDSESTPVVDPQKGTGIRFTILENRSQEVYVTIKAIGSDGAEYIISAQGQSDQDQSGQNQSNQGQPDQGQSDQDGPDSGDSEECWDNKEVSLSKSGSRQLPWEKLIILTGWKGTSADGQLPEGLYTLKVLVKDLDDNEVNEVYPEINADSTTRNDTERQFRIGSRD